MDDLQPLPPLPPRRSLLSEVDERYRHAAAIERAVYTLLRPFLAPLRRLSGYVSRERRRGTS